MTDSESTKDRGDVPAKPPLRERSGYQGLLLGGFATLAAILLASGNALTEAPIAARQQEDLLASLAQVIPADRHDQDLLAHTLSIVDAQDQEVTVYRAIKAGRVTGVAFEQTGQGYGGPIQVLLGVAPDGRLLGARVLAHAETPGLGDKIEAGRSDWIIGFEGLSIGNPPLDRWAVKKDGGRFDQFSGATITPRAVVSIIRRGLLLFQTNRGHLMDFTPSPPATLPPTSPQEHRP